MQFLDKTGVGTLWSMCKTKFALKDHSHNYLPLSGGTLTGDLLFSNSGTTFRQIRGTCGDNDFWRIGGGATGNNAGYMEIATADDGTEPIYVRQYSGTFSTITRTATLLDGSGNTSFPGTVAAAKFKGALEGNASTASNAYTVNGHTVNSNVPSNAKFTDTNTWRPIQDNLTSTSTSESLSANQGRVLKGLVDGKANSSHTHNSIAAVGNEQISATAYGSGLHFKPYYNSDGPTTYGNILEYTSTNTGGGQLAMEWTGSQTESDGTDSNVGRVYYRSKRDCVAGWTKWMTLAYINDIPTKLSQLTNDKGFVTGSVSGNTVTINGASTTWTNTWRGIQDNLTSSSTSDSLSANQGRILKGLVDGKANSSDLSSYSQKSETIKSIRFEKNGYTQGNSKLVQVLHVFKANGEDAYLQMYNADSNINGLMSYQDKVKLDGIAYGANNYSLPTASAATLGGIKISRDAPGHSWPICVDGNGLAETKIGGLVRGNDNSIAGIAIQDSYANTYYSTSSISVNPLSDENGVELIYPLKRGTFALLSDIPDVSNLCRFNFINSISECRSDRINFLLRCADTLIDLNPFDSYPDGTILIITTNENSANIKHQSGIWYSCGDRMNMHSSIYTYREQINLITKNNGTVHHYKI